MHKFKDTAGRAWLASLTVGTIKKAREVAGVDLAAISGGEVFNKLAADPVLLCTALYAISRPEAEGAPLPTLDEFLAAMDGDTIAAATDALVEETVGFFPKPIREKMLRAIAAAKEQAAVREAEAMRRLDETFSASPGSSPEPREESTPAT